MTLMLGILWRLEQTCQTWLNLWPDQAGRCATEGVVWVQYWTAVPW